MPTGTVLIEAVAVLSETPFFIDDSPVLSVTDMRSKARRLHTEQGLGLIIVDYLQLMQGAAENRVQEISAISRGLKAVARELDVPVLALAQLSRAPDQRPNHEPMLSDLRESGSIEQDADLVMFIYRDVVYNSETERPHVADIIVSKHRNGPTGQDSPVLPGRLDAVQRSQRAWRRVAARRSRCRSRSCGTCWLAPLIWLKLKAVLEVARLCAVARRDLVPLSDVMRPDSMRVVAGAGSPEPAEVRLRRAMDRAIGDGLLLSISVTSGESVEQWIGPATVRGRAHADRLQAGDPNALGRLGFTTGQQITVERPNIFSLYERHIGPLTPLVAEELRDVERTFPLEWIEEAMAVAADYNKRNWRYVQTILQSWDESGVTGTPPRNR